MELIKTKPLMRILILALISVMGSNGYSQNFQLKGTTKNNNGKLLFIYYTNAQQKDVADSVIIQDDKYSFSGTVDGPSLVYIGLKMAENRWDPDDNIGFFLEPTAVTITQTGAHIKNSVVEGSATQKIYHQFEQQREKLEQRWQVVMDTLQQVNKRSNTAYQKLKDWVLTPYFEESRELEISFMNDHPQSAITGYLLRFYVGKMDLDTLRRYYGALGATLQSSHYGKYIAREIASIQKGSPGSAATDFKTTDLNGKRLALSQFKGKYVLLDFWASWCVPCRASNPHLKALYRQYHAKGLEIIGVSDDDSAPDKWKAAVAKDGVGIWHNVLRGYDRNVKAGTENPKDISGKFGIHELPTKLLIDPSGTIIGRFVGTDDASLLEAALAEAFKNS